MTEVHLGLGELRADPLLKDDLVTTLFQYSRRSHLRDVHVVTVIWYPDEYAGTHSYVVRAEIESRDGPALAAQAEHWDVEAAVDDALHRLLTQMRLRLARLGRDDHADAILSW